MAADLFRESWHVDLRRFRSYAEALDWLRRHPNCGSERTIALIRWDRNADMCKIVSKFKNIRSELLPVLCLDDFIEGDVVVDAINVGAKDIIGPENRDFISEQLRKIAAGRSSYEGFMNIKLDRRKINSAFGVIPYQKSVLDTWEFGISPVMDRLGISLRLAKDRPSNLVLNKKIRDMIERSDLVLVDLSFVKPICGRLPSTKCWGMHNPNVYYETGYAHGIGKPVILLRCGSSQGPLPTIPNDLQGIEWQVYQNITHASLIIYHGLKV